MLGHAVVDRQRPVSHLFTGLFTGDDAVRAALVAALAQRQAAAGVRRLRVAVPDPSAAASFTHLGFRGVAHLVRYERPAQPPRSPGAGASGLRPFVPGDAAAVTRLDRRAFARHWRLSARRMRRTLGDRRHYFAVAEADGRVAGYVIAQVVGEAGHLWRLAVAPDCRRRGLGRALAVAAVHWLDAQGVGSYLNTEATNPATHGLFQSLGYRAAGRPPYTFAYRGNPARISFRRGLIPCLFPILRKTSRKGCFSSRAAPTWRRWPTGQRSKATILWQYTSRRVTFLMARLLGGVPVQEQLDTQLAPEQERQFRHWVGQREERMPAQYIVGRQKFYNLWAPLLQAGLRGKVNVLIANPPDLTPEEADALVPETRYEPRGALTAGTADPLAVHRLAVGHARDLLAPGGMLAMHVRPQRADELAAVVQAAGFRVETVPGSEAVYPTTVIGTMGAG